MPANTRHPALTTKVFAAGCKQRAKLVLIIKVTWSILDDEAGIRLSADWQR